MAYLGNDTGGTPEDRRSEADRLVKIISEQAGLSALTPKELDFVAQMDEGGSVSPKQVFWLRDIKDKYL